MVRAPKRSSEQLEWTPLREAEEVGPFVYSLCPMGLEVEEEHQCVCGLLQTYPFSVYVNLVVRKDEAFRRSEGDGCGGEEPGHLGGGYI